MSQVRALLLTDVVDSTALLEELGDERMAALWAAHDEISRELLEQHGGLEIDKSDGFLLLFESAADAVAFTAAYHSALAGLDPPLKARAGLHVGEVVLRENPPARVLRGAKPLEVEGLAKPVAARVMSLALGGQTLLTTEAHAALGPDAPRTESHGHWRLKGLAEAIEILEVGDDETSFAPPPDGAKSYRVVRKGEHWLPVREVPHRLPRELDAFVGRDADLRDLASLLDGDAPLVSVLGIGGTGKTRLVTHYGWTWLGDYPGGVWFCDLSEARSVAGICDAVARTLDVALVSGGPVAQLGNAIASREGALLILDNFEQVARHAGDTLAHWLDAAPGVQFLVTTREVLGLPGETSLALPPLSEDEAVALFVERARQGKRDFVLPDDARVHVEELVRLLDQLPLAIELAAARARVMSPEKLLERMSDRFRLLTSGGGRRDRQATLRGALDWSWDLLDPDEQRALAQLAVFEGGFSLEAAEAVLELESAWPMDAVQSLVDKSLVRPVGDERFDLLVSVQDYASERLGEDRVDVEVRHGAWFAELGSPETLERFHGKDDVQLREITARDLDNLVSASRRALERGDLETATRTVPVCWTLIELRGPMSLGCELLEAVVERLARSDARWADFARQAGEAANRGGRLDDSGRFLNEALTAARRTGDRRVEGRTLMALGVLHNHLGRNEEAGDFFSACLEAAAEAGDPRTVGRAHANLGMVRGHLNDLAGCREQLDASLEILPGLGDWFEIVAVSTIGNCCLVAGDVAEGRPYVERAVALARARGASGLMAHVQDVLGRLNAYDGRWDEGLAMIEESRASSRASGSEQTEAVTLINLAYIHRRTEHWDGHRSYSEQAHAAATVMGNPMLMGKALHELGWSQAKRGDLAEARASAEESLRISRELGVLVDEGNLLVLLGDLNAQEGRSDEAGANLLRAETILRDCDRAFDLLAALVARIHHEAPRNRATAERCLVEAEAIAERAGPNPESVWQRQVRSAREALERA
jgi:predicted ATPase/class 3 adenylate cyclase